jgi:large subunit ribosomal protein L32
VPHPCNSKVPKSFKIPGRVSTSKYQAFRSYLPPSISRVLGRLLLATMAATHVTARSILSSFLPRLSTSTASSATRLATFYSRQLSLPLLPSLSFAIPSAINLNVPSLEGIWESILKAVPKKKTSHMKKRTRQMAGKGLKDVTALNRCSACGHVKRAHLLCPYCVAGKPKGPH